MKDTYSAFRRTTPKPRKKHRAHFMLLLALLAAVCIGGMELAFCSLFAPALYRQITDPVVQPVVRAVEGIQARIEHQRFLRDRDAAAAQVAQGSGEYYVPKPVVYPEYVVIPTPSPTPEPTVPPVTQLVKEGGRELLTGGGVPCVYYNQGDEAWRGELFGSDPIGTYGCGPTAMAMVVSSLTDKPMDPAQMSAWAYEQGYWCSGSGSYLTIVDGTCEAFGLNSALDKQCDAEKLYKHLEAGGYAVALVGPGKFTSSNGHFIVLRGAAPDGRLLVADSGSRDNSLALWEPEQILQEAATSSGDGVAVWLISRG